MSFLSYIWYRTAILFFFSLPSAFSHSIPLTWCVPYFSLLYFPSFTSRANTFSHRPPPSSLLLFHSPSSYSIIFATFRVALFTLSFLFLFPPFVSSLRTTFCLYCSPWAMKRTLAKCCDTKARAISKEGNLSGSSAQFSEALLEVKRMSLFMRANRNLNNSFTLAS